jgi:hypothetical protein
MRDDSHQDFLRLKIVQILGLDLLNLMKFKILGLILYLLHQKKEKLNMKQKNQNLPLKIFQINADF